MKNILVIFLIIFLSACQQINEEELKDRIKNEILEELETQTTNFNDHLKEVSNKIKNCAVVVDVTMPTGLNSHGSGVIFRNDNNDYYILTNEHIIRYHEALNIYIPSLDRYILATPIKSNQELDLAILKITTSETLQTCEIKLVNFEVGELVLSVGTPIGLEYANTVTLGIISKIDGDLIQHDAAINPGSSGGPLYNIEGQLIGINVSKLNTTNSGSNTVTVSGIGFSIPVQVILDFINS